MSLSCESHDEQDSANAAVYSARTCEDNEIQYERGNMIHNSETRN